MTGQITEELYQRRKEGRRSSKETDRWEQNKRLAICIKMLP